MMKYDGQTFIVVQDRWPWGGICQNAQEMGNILFHWNRVLLDVAACEETSTASEGYFAGTEDRGANVGFHGSR